MADTDHDVTTFTGSPLWQFDTAREKVTFSKGSPLEPVIQSLRFPGHQHTVVRLKTGRTAAKVFRLMRKLAPSKKGPDSGAIQRKCFCRQGSVCSRISKVTSGGQWEDALLAFNLGRYEKNSQFSVRPTRWFNKNSLFSRKRNNSMVELFWEGR